MLRPTLARTHRKTWFTAAWRPASVLELHPAASACAEFRAARDYPNRRRRGCQRRHVTDDAIILEVIIRGPQLGAWRGLPATGRRVELPLCGIYTFDADNHLAGEKIYYDRGTVLRQLGVFHEPPSVLGQIGILLTHPITIARALARKIRGK